MTTLTLYRCDRKWKALTYLTHTGHVVARPSASFGSGEQWVCLVCVKYVSAKWNCTTDNPSVPRWLRDVPLGLNPAFDGDELDLLSCVVAENNMGCRVVVKGTMIVKIAEGSEWK